MINKSIYLSGVLVYAVPGLHLLHVGKALREGALDGFLAVVHFAHFSVQLIEQLLCGLVIDSLRLGLVQTSVSRKDKMEKQDMASERGNTRGLRRGCTICEACTCWHR
jgi:hypothetical protein